MFQSNTTALAAKYVRIASQKNKNRGSPTLRHSDRKCARFPFDLSERSSRCTARFPLCVLCVTTVDG